MKKKLLTQALIGEPPALRQKTDRTQSIRFGPLDEYDLQTIKTPVKVLPKSPARHASEMAITYIDLLLWLRYKLAFVATGWVRSMRI